MESRNVARTLVAVGLLFSPLGVSAQQAGSGIAGVVRDATGAVLPGVTVEASSPALIERVRTATTDGQGQYKIVDLLPGTYSVTFSLTGFSSVRRDGIELVTAFVATLNPEMKVGSVEETITVSGAAPSVDIHNVVQHRVLTREVFDALPTNKGIPSYGALTPGIVIPPNFQDVGGNKGEQSFRMVIHGGTQSEQRLLQDGMRYNSAEGTGRGFYIRQRLQDLPVLELHRSRSAERQPDRRDPRPGPEQRQCRPADLGPLGIVRRTHSKGQAVVLFAIPLVGRREHHRRRLRKRDPGLMVVHPGSGPAGGVR
ncbi:MAG: hypothetical protein DMF96_23925 [Acidobacteria bacterium]|nr:MAG: hypothetical protein DMF96_23925 [Acidobacteriota bacterium]